MLNSKVIIIAGCTASGKSDIALRLAKDIDGVIINGDSRQIYKEMNIGTAKPIPDKTENNVMYIQNIPHYLYSYVSVKDSYSIYNYQKDVFEIIKNLPKEKTPIIVGGTGLYIDSVVFNYKLEKNQINNYENLSTLNIYQLQKILGEEKLKELNLSDRNNPRRLIRILQRKNNIPKKGKPLVNIYFVIDKPVDELKKNISKRVDTMILNGLIDENKEIRKNNLQEYHALKSIGYQEFDGYFEGNKSLDDVKEEIINHTNQYSKRQRTWFRRNKSSIFVNDYKIILEKSKEFISKSPRHY